MFVCMNGFVCFHTPTYIRDSQTLKLNHFRNDSRKRYRLQFAIWVIHFLCVFDVFRFNLTLDCDKCPLECMVHRATKLNNTFHSHRRKMNFNFEFNFFLFFHFDNEIITLKMFIAKKMQHIYEVCIVNIFTLYTS